MQKTHQDDLYPLFYAGALRSLLHALHDGVCCLNAQGELLFANEAAQKHWRLQSPSRQGDSFLLLPPVAKALAGEEVHHALVRTEETHTLLLNLFPLISEADAVTAIMMVSRDVSEPTSLHQQAKISLDLLVEALLETHTLREPGEALRRIAALLLQLDAVDHSFAFLVDEHTGHLKPVAFFGTSQQSIEAWQAELSALERSAEHPFQAESAYLRVLHLKRPLLLDFSVEASPSYAPHLCAALYVPVMLNEHVLGVLGIERHRPLGDAEGYFPQWSVDLLQALARLVCLSSERASLFHSSARQGEEIEAMHKLLSQKEEFLSLTAHELKNPLTSIIGHAQIAQRRLKQTLHPGIAADHELLTGLKSIERQAQKVAHMVNALLDVNRLDLERLDIERQEVDLVQLAKRTLEDYLPLAPRHELRLFVDGQPVPVSSDDSVPLPQGSLSVLGDKERLEQVLLNLLSNAVRYSPEGGPVTLSLRHTADGAREMVVEDQGIGIPPTEQTHLTERFFRAQNAQEIDARGMGLGLYLTHALIRKHGGSLTIASAGIAGKGSRFTVSLPSQV